jgi:hypothetical protein
MAKEESFLDSIRNRVMGSPDKDVTPFDPDEEFKEFTPKEEKA